MSNRFLTTALMLAACLLLSGMRFRQVALAQNTDDTTAAHQIFLPAVANGVDATTTEAEPLAPTTYDAEATTAPPLTAAQVAQINAAPACPVWLSIVNQTVQGITINWVRLNGSEQRYYTLAAGRAYWQQSSDGQLWRMRNSQGSLLKEYRVSGCTQQQVLVQGSSTTATPTRAAATPTATATRPAATATRAPITATATRIPATATPTQVTQPTATATATTGTTTCPTANFVAVPQHPANTAYPAPQLSVSCTSSQVVVQTNNIPNFEFVQITPNRLQAQNYTLRFPLKPVMATTPSSIPLGGQIAVTVNGLVIFGPTEAPNDGYRDPYLDGILDYCNGHTAPGGVYHFHARPDCIFTDLGQPTAANVGRVLAYAFDGYPILAPYVCADATCTTVKELKSSWRVKDASASNAWEKHEYVAGLGDLDQCNGLVQADGSYAYYATDTFPYFIGCYRGVR